MRLHPAHANINTHLDNSFINAIKLLKGIWLTLVIPLVQVAMKGVLSMNTWQILLSKKKKDVHFPIELMYEQCVTAVGCKNVYETISFT